MTAVLDRINTIDEAIQAEFQGAAVSLMTEMDMSPVVSTIEIIPGAVSLTALAHSPAAGVYANIHLLPGWKGKIGLRTKEEESFNGLFRAESGHLDLPNTKHFTDEGAYVQFVTSPEGHNRVLQNLGRKPGEDSLEFLIGSTGRLTAGHITQAWSKYGRLTAPHDHWEIAAHDMKVAWPNHAFSWMALRPRALHKSVEHASDLVKNPRLADLVDHEIYKGPPEFAEFARGTEELQVITGELLETIEKSVRLTDETILVATAAGKLTRENSKTLRRLGIISGNESPRRILAEVRDTASHIAGLLLKIDKVTNTDRPGRQSDRLRIIATDFAAA